MIVINNKKAYALFCMRNIVLSPLLPDYVRRSKKVKELLIKKGKAFNIYVYAIRYFELYLLPNKLSCDWNLKDEYYSFNSF